MDFIGYDFDKTVYQGDSSTHFTLWCLSRYPKTWLRLPEMGWYSLLFALKLCPKTRFKSHLFSYLRHVPEMLFKATDSIEYGAHISRLLNDLELPAEETDPEKGDETL